MFAYIIKRILSLIPVLLFVSIIIFLIIHLTPGDPAAVMLGPDAEPEQVEELHKQMGLDEPIYQQYWNWVIDALHGDLGQSYFMQDSVTQTIISHSSPTISIAILGEVIALIIAIPIGIIASKRNGTAIDQAVMGFSFMGMAVPSFLLGLILILIFGVSLGWLPVAGYKPLSAGLWEHLKYLILPAVSLGTIQAALTARMTRSSMLEVLDANFIKALRSKGVKERGVTYKHALRNSFLPILTVIGQSIGVLVTGAVVTETIFNIPGIGQLIINSIERRDYSVIQGVVLMVTLTYLGVNFIIDLLYGVIDPRVRLGRK